MNTVRNAASSLNLAAGAAALLLGWVWPPVLSCPSNGCPFNFALFVMPYLGLLLIADSIACFDGLKVAFAAGIVLSVATAAAALYEVSNVGGSWELLLAAVSVIALPANILAFKSRGKIAEQTHPLNLPVFG